MVVGFWGVRCAHSQQSGEWQSAVGAFAALTVGSRLERCFRKPQQTRSELTSDG